MLFMCFRLLKFLDIDPNLTMKLKGKTTGLNKPRKVGLVLGPQLFKNVS